MELAAWTVKLLATAALLGGFAKLPAPPAVALVPGRDLSALFCNGGCRVQGAYLPGRGILLAEGLDLEDPVGRSVLLHELVHYLQDTAGRFGREPPCIRWVDRETEAYDIQDTYLSRYNLGLGASMESVLEVRPAGCTAERDDVTAPPGADDQDRVPVR